MGDIVTFHRDGRTARTWVRPDEEQWWLDFWSRAGIPAARWRDYRRWGGFWPRFPESADSVMFGYPVIKRPRRTYK